MSVRVRFAPSPTGYLHVGGLRTALYNFLYANHHGGKFILRIEDTDQSRKVEGAMENLIETLKWAGVEFDEGPGKDGRLGPYIQSQRLSLYHHHVQMLLENDKAYYCFCTSERLEQVRKQQAESGIDSKYDRFCRNIPYEEAKKRAASDEPHVVRMKVPLDGEMTFEDIIRGKVTIAFSVLDDQVILKSDGFPTYHLAVVVDDHLMDISHVIRGEEWLPSTPKHILLYQYFGWNVPKFAHLPLLLNADKSKLSKRQGDVAVEDYRAKGYLKEALVNFVAFLGWNPGDEREIFSTQDLIKEFSLERVGKAGAVFNIDKLNWMNQQHIKLKSDEELLELTKTYFQQQQLKNYSDEYLKNVIHLLKERVVVLGEFITKSNYFFNAPASFDPVAQQKNWGTETSNHMKILVDKFSTTANLNSLTAENTLRQAAQQLNINAGKLIHPLRLSLTGVAQGPSLFHLIEVLGKEETIQRINSAIEKLK